MLPLDKPTQELFGLSYRTGNSLFRARDFPNFARLMRSLSTAGDESAWIAKVGLCRGLFVDRPDSEIIEGDYGVLIDFLTGLSLRAKLGLKVQQLLEHRRSRRLSG